MDTCAHCGRPIVAGFSPAALCPHCNKAWRTKSAVAATVFGMPAMDLAAMGLSAPASSAQTPSTSKDTLRDGQVSTDAANQVGAARTMFGMPAVLEKIESEMYGKAARPSAAQPISQPAPQSTPQFAPQPAPEAAAAVAQPNKPKKIAANRTMLGVAVQAPAAKREPMPTMAGARFETQAFTIDGTIAGIPSTSKSRLKLWLGLGIFSALVLASALGGYLYYSGLPRSEASLVSEGGHRVLAVRILRGDWQRVRALGGEAAVEAGTARVAVEAAALNVGEHLYDVTLVAASGETRIERLLLRVDYNIDTDLSHVADLVGPHFTLRITVPAGATAKVDGVAIPVSGTTASLDVGLENPSLAGLPVPEARYLESTKRVEVTHDGHSFRETVATRVAFAGLRVDAPGTILHTDHPFQLVGRTDVGARVLLGDEAIEVASDGRFSVPRGVPCSGETAVECVLRVTAIAPGKLAAQTTIQLSHNVSPTVFAAVRTVPYTELAQAGLEPIVLRGEVYNVQTDGPRRVLQMLSTPCTGADRCPVWVEFDEVRPVGTGAGVRVLGRYSGTQQFRTANGEMRTVPKIDAMLVLPD